MLIRETGKIKHREIGWSKDDILLDGIITNNGETILLPARDNHQVVNNVITQQPQLFSNNANNIDNNFNERNNRKSSDRCDCLEESFFCCLDPDTCHICCETSFCETSP